MYCVIQQVVLKKHNPYGEYRKIEVYQNEWRIAGDKRPCTWAYRYTGGRFERPRRDAYKITLHQSYREGGKVRKRQYSVCTMSYYELCGDCSWWGDFIVGGEKALAEKVGADPDELYDLIEAKLGPLRERLEAEFHQTEEYRTKQEHERIIADHLTAQNKFCSKYDVEKDEYNRCYDVFGVLRNRGYLAKIQAQHKARKQSERRYQESWRSTYEQYTSGSYSVSASSTYTDAERDILRQFYRSLSKTYHPDLNPGKDTTAQMQLLNRLKEVWGV